MASTEQNGYPTLVVYSLQPGSGQSGSPAPGNPQGEADKPVDANAGQKAAVKEALAKGAKAVTLTYTEYNKMVDKEIFKEIAEKDITVTFNMGDVWWIVNGTDIPADTDFKDLNLGVTVDRDGTKKLAPVEVINPLTGDVKTIQCELLHNGPFGFKMYLHINLGKEFAGMTVLLRYYNEATGMLEEVTSGVINSDGIVLLPMEHASKYVLSIGAEVSEDRGGQFRCILPCAGCGCGNRRCDGREKTQTGELNSRNREFLLQNKAAEKP